MEQTPDLFFIFVVFVFGMIIGSFLNVLIYRLPRDKSIIYPPSSCPECGHKIKWYENIPIISYLILKGKCSSCRKKISLRYPFVEFLTGLSAVVSYLKWGFSLDFVFSFLFLSLVIVVIFVDIDFKIIPDEINLIGFMSGIIYSFFRSDFSVFDAVIGAFVGAGFLSAVAYFYLKFRKIEGLGMGDVKLLAFLGTYLGWFGSLFTIFLGSLIGAVVGIYIAYLQKAEDKSRFEIPFGPFLSVAAVVYLFFGKYIKNFYFGY
ncbi:MAG: prepilin peptidase [Aquificota bacterium]|nr:MAG: prepilin peptidase [Aquificota bacterium]